MNLVKTGVKPIFLAALCLVLRASPHVQATPNFYAAGVDNSEIGDRIPLILIHGILEDASIWNAFLNYYNTAPTLKDYFKPYVFEYKTRESELGEGDPQNVSALGQALGGKLQTWYASPTGGPTYGFNGKPVVILGHSMGGLVARSMMTYYLFGHGTSGSDKVSMLITLATPHHGTPLGNEYMDAYPLAGYFIGLYPSFAYNMEWDCYDGTRFSGECGVGIPSSAYYSKIVAYGALLTPPGPDSTLDKGHWVLCQDGYCASDGAVPLESALFYPNPVQKHYVDGSCDHNEIYNGSKTVDAGSPIFASIKADLLTLISVSLPPAIYDLLPSSLTGLPLPQTQPIRIIGSGFTSSSTLTFNDGVNPPYTGRVPVFISASELDYNIAVGTSAATWTVKVVNGAQSSPPRTFTVAAPPLPSVGSLTVTLQPAGAVSAGAQWQVDSGAYRNSGDIVAGLAPGSHTIACKAVTGYSAPASHSVSITGGTVANDTETYSIIAPTTYALTLNQGGAMGSISPSPMGTWNGSAYVYATGSVVQLSASANPGYHFVGWGGDLSGTANPSPITMDRNKTVTASFFPPDLNMGTVIVNVQPPAAATAGVKWGWNQNDYRDSGTSYTTWAGAYFIVLHPVDGWISPVPSGLLPVTLTAGQTTTYTATFTQDTTPGLLTVTVTPPNAVAAGAAWHVNGGSAQGNGTSVSLPAGSYTVTFDAIAGWTTPQAQTVQVVRAQTAVATANYTPPVGQPLITAIHPGFGSLAGGTPLTIEGVNCTAPVTVWIGGKSAANVNVLSPSQITCLLPSSSVYGTQPVVVQTSGGSATNLNGFAYGTPRGSGIELIASLGGRESAVAVQGNYAYVGEGSSLLVVSISNPSSPSFVSRLALPANVLDIALNGQYAYVADGDAGLQVVDISNPTVPLLKGFYQTPGWARAIAIQTGKVYVADGAGLEILDLSNPKYPLLLGSTSYNGAADNVVVQSNGSGMLAYLSSGEYISVIDVSQASSPVLRGHVHIGGLWSSSITLCGKYIFAASVGDGLHMVDVSNVNAPLDLGSVAAAHWPDAVTTINGQLHAVNSLSGPNSGYYVFSVTGSTLSQVGHTTGITSGSGGRMAVSGNRAYIAALTSGLMIVDVSNSANPSQLATFTDFGACGDYFSAAASGNALCASVGSDFKVFDISQPGQPNLVGQLSGIGYGGQVLAKDGIAFLRGSGVNAGMCTRIISIAAPSSPQLLTTIPYTAVQNYRMALAGNRLYVVGQNGTQQPRFSAFDISTPSSPPLLGVRDYATLSAGSAAISVAVSGSKALVGIQGDSGSNEISILDISNITAPVERSSVSNIGLPKDVAMSADGHYSYVADWTRNFCVLDVSDTAHPVLVAKVATTWLPYSLKVQGNLVYVASWGAPSGVYVFDVSNPAAPILADSYETAGEAYDVSFTASQPGMMYVANLEGGLAVLRMKDVTSPRVSISVPTSAALYTTPVGSVSVAGNASDDVGVASVTWSNSRGGGGRATGTSNWSVNGVVLLPGTNILTVTAFDATGNSSNAALTVIYQTASQSQTITFSAIADHTFGDPPIQLLTAASSGLPVNFAVISGPASVSNDVMTLTGAGVVAVQANQAGNGSFNPATPVHVNFNVARADQSIAFPGLADRSASDPPFSITATASSGLQVFFAVSGPATLSSNLVTLLGSGPVAIMAWQPGNSNFNAAASVQRSFNVTKIPQSITFGPLSQQSAGDAPYPLGATASSGLPVSFAIVSGPAALDGNIITLTGWGTVVVRASQAGDAMYAAAADVVQSFSVVPPGSTIVNPQRMPDGTFEFAFYGAVGSNYTLQASTSLTDWTSLFSFACTNSPTVVRDASAASYSRRFYRVAGQ
jgi:uncharacterized repeat protein (TIGR02543 family)